MRPFISVVMPVRNEASFIHDTLCQLITQDYPVGRYEIIVADGMSDDGTQEIVLSMACQYQQILLLDNQKRLSSAGRNVGFRNGKGDYFLVVDGHCYIPDNQLFNNLSDCFAQSGADCLCRPQPLDPPGLTIFQQSVAMARGSRLGHGGDSLIYSDYEGYCSPVSNGAAYRKEVFEKVGFVDEDFDAAEDVEFNFRVQKAGLKSYTSPRLKIRYYPRESPKKLFRQILRYGKGRYRFIRKHKEALTINQLIPTCFVAGFLFLLILGLAALNFGSLLSVFSILLIIYILYVVLVLTESFLIASRLGFKYFLFLPIIFLIIHSALGLGFIQEAVNHKPKS